MMRWELLSFYSPFAGLADSGYILTDALNRLAAHERTYRDDNGNDYQYPFDHLSDPS